MRQVICVDLHCLTGSMYGVSPPTCSCMLKGVQQSRSNETDLPLCSRRYPAPLQLAASQDMLPRLAQMAQHLPAQVCNTTCKNSSLQTLMTSLS